MLVLSISMYAQREVTKFLGIPVDGTKSEMIQKLKAKGFEEIPGSDGTLSGEFNGREVYLFVHTNNNKVWRIAVADVNSVDEAKIKVRFNRLCRQFYDNKKYIATVEDDFILSDEFKIGYAIRLNHEQIEASFFQKTFISEEDEYEYLKKRGVWFMIAEESYAKYKIVMFYENRYNEANGDDL